MDGVSAKARDPAKFKPFLVYGTRYRTDNGHEIGLDLLVPKGLKPGTQKHPLIVRFHGGFLVSNPISYLAVSSFAVQDIPPSLLA